jgi:hypothetical protein
MAHSNNKKKIPNISPLSAEDESEYIEYEFVIALHLAKKDPHYIAY